MKAVLTPGRLLRPAPGIWLSWAQPGAIRAWLVEQGFDMNAPMRRWDDVEGNMHFSQEEIDVTEVSQEAEDIRQELKMERQEPDVKVETVRTKIATWAGFAMLIVALVCMSSYMVRCTFGDWDTIEHDCELRDDSGDR